MSQVQDNLEGKYVLTSGSASYLHQQIDENTIRPDNPFYLGAFPIGAYNGL